MEEEETYHRLTVFLQSAGTPGDRMTPHLCHVPGPPQAVSQSSPLTKAAAVFLCSLKEMERQGSV